MDDPERTSSLTELSVVGVRVELPSQQPIVLLKEVDGDRYLPIWIGAVEATAIAFAQQGVVTARPMTHDLMRDLLEAFDRPLRTVTIISAPSGRRSTRLTASACCISASWLIVGWDAPRSAAAPAAPSALVDRRLINWLWVVNRS